MARQTSRFAVVLTGLTACVGAADGGEAPDTSDSGNCSEAATLDWDNFGHGFLLENCDGCHAATSEHRQDAPIGTTFDTVAEAWVWAPQILASATGSDPTMPPRGGVSDDDRTRLFWWLGCGAPGT